MIKNNEYEITICNTRNDVIDALDQKKMFIQLTDELNNEIMPEFKKQVSSNKLGYSSGKMVEKLGKIGAGGLALDLLLGAGTGGIGLLVEFLGIVIGGKVVKAMFNTDFNGYDILIMKIHQKDVIAFLNHKFNKKYDTIIGYEQYKFLDKIPSKCPNCKYPIEKNSRKYNPIKCPNCKKEYIIKYDSWKCKHAQKK